MEKILLQQKKLINAPIGISMLPLLRPNRDVVVLENTREPQKYDVVVYKRSNGKYILHRLMDIKGTEYIMCGDNQYVLETGICRDQILAVMTGFYRDSKYYAVENQKYQFYVKWWCKSLFIRKYLVKIGYFYRKIKVYLYEKRK